MIKPIMKNVLFLAQRSKPCTKEDLPLAKDLADTLSAHADACVGMAANMIGVLKNAIIVNTGLENIVMFNPTILSKSGQYQTEEGCLSLTGVRKTVRWRSIEVEYTDVEWKRQTKRFTGFAAQIVQHELDHLNGTII